MAQLQGAEDAYRRIACGCGIGVIHLVVDATVEIEDPCLPTGVQLQRASAGAVAVALGRQREDAAATDVDGDLERRIKGHIVQ